MPNTRIMLWVAFAAILYLNYEAWMHDYREPRRASRRAIRRRRAGRCQDARRFGTQGTNRRSNAAATATPGLQAAPPPTPPGATAAADAAAEPAASPTLHVVTDVLDRQHQLEGRRDRPRRSPAVSAAQGRAEHPGAARKCRSQIRCICCRPASSAARAKPRPRTWRYGPPPQSFLRAARRCDRNCACR